jgi:hypothetical protein
VERELSSKGLIWIAYALFQQPRPKSLRAFQLNSWTYPR